MSKFWFFDRKGRPTTNEKRICDTFNTRINEGKVSAKQVEDYLEEYGKPMNENELEDMFGYLTGEYPDGKKYQYADSDSDIGDDEEYDDDSADYEEYEESESINNSSSDSANQKAVDFNPFEEPVIERSYTGGFRPKNENLDDESDSEDNSDYEDDSNSQNVDFSNDDLKMPKDGESIIEQEEDIPEPEWANTGGVSSNLEDDEEEEDDEDYDDEGGDKLGGDNLQDLTPAQKRKSAEKTAEALLNMYCQFAPLPFKKWASISDGKVQKLVFEKRIDLSMQLENNITVKDYIDGTNEQVEEVFTISEETREEIKEPLVDVLLEQDLALTPTQRLLLAVGGNMVTMAFSAFQLSQNNKQALETFEKFQIQMNKQKAPAFQETERVAKKTPRPRPQDDLTKHEKESVEEMMRMMNQEDEDDIIDAEHDPSVDVSEDYGDDD
jgi:hypothetical protein